MRHVLDHENGRRRAYLWGMTSSGDNQTLVDARAIAELFHVTVETVRTWTRQGRIPHMRPSRGTVRYSVEAVRAAIERPADFRLAAVQT